MIPENPSSLAEPPVELPDITAPDLGSPSSDPIDPNNPPWGITQAFLTWLTSLGLLLIVPLVAVVPYMLYRTIAFGTDQPETLLADKTFIFISILGIFPTHVLLFAVIWIVVTNRGRRPFWQSFGWSWPKHFGPLKSIALAVVLLLIGWLITQYLGGGETQLDQLINSSYRARVATAVLAVATGPLVEELLYRGMLYAALQRALGVFAAVVLVSILFAGVHVFQYYNNLGVIAVISLLSVALTLVRAYTGTLLPSFVMHVVFNGIQSFFLVLQPIVQKFQHETDQTATYIIESISRNLG